MAAQEARLSLFARPGHLICPADAGSRRRCRLKTGFCYCAERSGAGAGWQGIRHARARRQRGIPEARTPGGHAVPVGATPRCHYGRYQGEVHDHVGRKLL